jgi:PhnB protein
MKEPRFQGITLAIRTRTPAEAERIFHELGVGGQVHMPLMKTFFSSNFGMLQDRFGVGWMVVAAPQE